MRMRFMEDDKEENEKEREQRAKKGRCIRKC